MSEWKETINAINNAERIMISSHIVPDGDSIGSLLAIGLAMEKTGKHVEMVITDKVPETFAFLPGAAKIKLAENTKPIFDLVICLDSGELHRLGGPVINIIKESESMVINIDHHKTNDPFGDINVVDANAAATGFLIYKLLIAMGVEIDSDVATCLYTCLQMDTGSFQFSNTNSEVHEMAAALIRKGARYYDVNLQLYYNKPLESLKLLAMALNTLQVDSSEKMAWITVSKEMFEQAEAREEHVDGIINYAKMINGVDLAILFKELSADRVKVGFRSKQSVDVSHLAGQFGGGGHARAAGCIVQGSLAEVQEKVLETALATL